MKTELKTIVDIVCDFYKIDPKLIESKTRVRSISEIRQICHYFARKHTEYSYSIIGENIGMKDHCSVIYSQKVVNDRIDTYKSFRTKIDDLNKRIKSFLFDSKIVIEHKTYTEIIHKSKGFLI